MNLYLGTYAAAGGKGLYPLSADGGWSLGEPVAAFQNCSFAAFDRDRRLGYFIDERADGRLRVGRLGDRGWEQVAEHATGGAEPCYVALNAGRTRLAVANYGSGSIALFTLDAETGCPAGEPRLWQGSGNGPVSDRQDGPHIHCTIFDGDDRLLAVDLGSDRILGFDLADEGPPPQPQVAFAAPAGSGPRHLVFHPHLPVAYLVSELAGTLTVLDRAGPRFLARASCSIAPPDFSGSNLGGHLSLNAAGTRLYVSNRGHDSIGVFAVAEGGSVAVLQHVSTGGASPRSFVLLEGDGLCVVANEEAQNLTILPLGKDGLLNEPTTSMSAPGAAFFLTASVDGPQATSRQR